MSTVFEVFTTTKDAPSFNDVLSMSNEYLSAELRRHNIDDMRCK
jgi:hypothetical protein